MRYFWSLILILVLGTAGLSALRWSKSGQNVQGTAGDTTARSAPATPAASAPAEDRVAPPPPIVQEPERPSRLATEPAAIAESAPPVSAPIESPSEPATVDPAVARAEQPAAAPSDATVVTKPATPATGSEFTLDGLLGVVAEAAERATPVTEPAPPASQPATDPMLAAAAQSLESQASTAAANTAGSADAPGPVGPAFRVRDDGSIEIESVGVITGAGTPQRPYVLDWDVLRSLSREFNPRQGQSEVPAWVMQLHGKRVRVEGNTLLPVVAQTTNELLVMQNPWDGCCLGVPPTPYDAIEVKLASMQRMGNSPTGYGQVEGVFKVDPYIVSGWLLGLYVIDEAGFESGAGITLPEL